MRLDAATQRAHPKLKQYLKDEMPKAAEIKVIVSAIKKFAGTITRAEIKTALEWGKDPLVVVTPNLWCAGVKAFGCTRPGSPDQIEVDRALVQRFERGRDKVRTGSGKRVSLLGATLLHELTHWADLKDGIDTAGEEGNKFETEIYGKVVF